jgi:hypothetical protein
LFVLAFLDRRAVLRSLWLPEEFVESERISKELIKRVIGKNNSVDFCRDHLNYSRYYVFSDISKQGFKRFESGKCSDLGKFLCWTKGNCAWLGAFGAVLMVVGTDH